MFSLNNFEEFIYSVERALPIKAYEFKPYSAVEPLVEETTESIFETLKNTALQKIRAFKKILETNITLLLTDMDQFIIKHPEILLDVALMVFLSGFLLEASIILHDQFLEISNEPFKQALKKQTSEQGITLTQPQIDNFLQLYKTDKLKI
tara:strand:+ start:58 stop:507 length:450 start_codon:yes stop_codon:yes gene_type:complete